MAETGPGQALSFQAAIDRALENNPELLAIEQRYRAAQERIPQVSALPEPRLQVMHFIESVQTRTGPQESVVSLSQGVPWPGTLRQREDRSAAEAEALWQAYLAAQLRLVRETGAVYYKRAYLDKALEISDENLRLLQDLLPVVEEKVRGGGDLSSLLRLQVEVGHAREVRDVLSQQRRVAAAELQELLAMDDVIFRLTWDMPVPHTWEAAALKRRMETTNPELRAAELKASSAGAAMELARLRAYPELNFGINYIQLGESTGPVVPDSGKDPWGVTFSMTLPIQVNKNRAARREAIADRRASEAEIAHVRNRLNGDLQVSLARYADAQRRFKRYDEELIPLAMQAWEISQTSYQSGKTGITEVIESERSLLQLRLEHWRAAADLWQHAIEIETLTNAPAFVRSKGQE